MKNDIEFLQLNDLYASAFLLLNDIPLDHLERDSKGRATFYFLKTAQSLRLLRLFTQFKARVEPTAFVVAQKKLKQLLYLPNN